jgi:hypothetical protein
MAVRLSALRAGRPLPPGRFQVLIPVRGWGGPRVIIRPEGLYQLKNLLTSSGIEPTTFPILAYYINQLRYHVPQDRAVGIAIGYELDDRGVWVRVPVGSRIIFSPPALGLNQPPIQWVTGALSSGVELQGREADHSPPASAEFKKIWIRTPSWRSA